MYCSDVRMRIVISFLDCQDVVALDLNSFWIRHFVEATGEILHWTFVAGLPGWLLSHLSHPASI